jgi:hypothetical protein
MGTVAPAVTRSLRLRFWWAVMDAATLGLGIPRGGLRRRLFFWAVGKAYEAEGHWIGVPSARSATTPPAYEEEKP